MLFTCQDLQTEEVQALDCRVLSILLFFSGITPLIELGDSCIIKMKYVLIKL